MDRAPPAYGPPLVRTTLELLTLLSLTQLLPIFERELLDLEAILLCDDADLEKVGIPLGARRRIAHALVPIRQARQAQIPLGVSTATVTFQPLSGPQPAAPLRFNNAAAAAAEPAAASASASTASALAQLSLADANQTTPWIPQGVELLDLSVQPATPAAASAGAALRVMPALVTREREGQLLVELAGEEPGRTGVWLDATSPNLRPIGWARLHDLPLTLHPGAASVFHSWDSFLNAHVRQRRDATLFTFDQTTPPGYVVDETHPGPDDPPRHGFREGMRLEACDMMPSSNLICAATVAAVRGPQILIHFDGWSAKYDYWAMHDSTKLFPCGYCLIQQLGLQPPRGRSNSGFTWSEYLTEIGAVAAPVTCFPHVPLGSMFATHDPVAGAPSNVF